MASLYDHKADRDAPATPTKAHLRAAMEPSERDVAAGRTVPMADVLAERDVVLDRIEARRRTRWAWSDFHWETFDRGWIVTESERGSTNVYADLGFPNADEMLAKAQVATRIGEVIKRRRLTVVEAAKHLGLPFSELLGLQRGQFRDISHADMLNALAQLEHDGFAAPPVAGQDLSAGYAAMAAYEAREAEADAWSEALLTDGTDEPAGDRWGCRDGSGYGRRDDSG